MFVLYIRQMMSSSEEQIVRPHNDWIYSIILDN